MGPPLDAAIVEHPALQGLQIGSVKGVEQTGVKSALVTFGCYLRASAIWSKINAFNEAQTTLEACIQWAGPSDPESIVANGALPPGIAFAWQYQSS